MISVLQREPTPNPNAFKYHTNKRLLDEGTLSFGSEREAANFPMARQLFETGSVTAVMVADDFVSISADAWADWEAIEQALEGALPLYDFNAAKQLADKARAAEAAQHAAAGDNPLLVEINQLIDTYVRPALAGDGGGLEIVGMDDDKVVTVRYQGACGSCPSATAQTLMAIEAMLKNKIDPEISVISNA